ncbi:MULTISPECIES: metal ABC transporter solute-binding protein, Zn/Mn family [Leuconostoc]|uniref:3-phosphoglycerate kinase n=1 Tax=Leuconostoc kimchii TaxID=136609 RepID=A0ABX5SNI1_9LACO|nr:MULTISPECIES: zinc ABC transporter substrate-binding protein [Leuconostoc]AEJ30941.1 ABC heavy metal transporter, periplasmic ligand binding protein [Leuconostoc sp. C2]QBR48038.1 3-phosphoglycerate kinase [Leuconostoc kimchii]
MNKQNIYAILTILLIPVGLFLISIKMTVETKQPQHTPVQIVTDNVAYQQIAQAVSDKSSHVSLLSGKLTSEREKTLFKHAEVVIVDDHQNQLLTQRRNLKLNSKVLVASDVVKDQSQSNYWLSPEITLKTISRLSDLLSDFDPRNRDMYIKNSQKLAAETQELTQGISDLKAQKNVRYVATNNAQQVFMDQLNYTTAVTNLEASSDDKFKKTISEIQNKQVRFVLTASQDQSTRDQYLVKQAKDAKIPVITVNQVLPSDQKIWHWQLVLVRQLQAVFKSEESGK